MEITKKEVEIIVETFKELQCDLKMEWSSDLDEEQKTFLKKMEELLILPIVVRQSEQLCQYDKMCVRKRLRLECPEFCKDDTRLLA